MNWIQFLLSAFLILALPPAQGVGGENPMSEEKPEQIVVKANSAFALTLLAQLKGREQNTFISPVSISTALAMTMAGAGTETRSQMAIALQLPRTAGEVNTGYRALIRRLEQGPDEKNCLIRIANALWGQAGYSFLEGFIDLTRKNYEAEIREVDFIHASETARSTINRWVEDRTEKKIKDLIKPGFLGPMTRLVLTNAVYFKGRWELPFDKKRTRQADFTMEKGEKVSVPMMEMKDRFNYMDGDGFQALELRYEGDRMSMVVFLPDAPGGLAAFENKLAPDKLENWLKRFQMHEVQVALPRFKITFEVSLPPMLEALGMVNAFDPALADFSGMNGKKDLFISGVVHKAFVEVNEEGTEAAAATGVAMSLTAMVKPKVFRADHPFLFFIRDCEKGAILFAGRLVNP